LSDYQLEDTVYLPFTTRAFATGIPTVLVSGTVEIYEDASVTQITGAETLAVSLDSVVGFNMVSVVATAANGFGAGQSYTAILSVGTVGGVSVVGEVIGHFTLDMSAAAKDLANATDGLSALKTLIDALPTAAAVVNEWETQSQADPTGFHVNVLEVGGTGQTANDNGADINTILSRIIGTLASGTHNPATAAQIAVLSDWINGGRLDLILDIIAADVVNLDGAAMRGTDGANTTVPDVAGTAPTAVEIRQEMDTNSVDLNALITAIGTAGAGLTDLGAMSTAMKAEILSEVNAALDTAISELGVAAPTATPTLRTGLMLLYMAFRNKGTQTSTTKTISNDAETTIASAAISADPTTFTKEEYS